MPLNSPTPGSSKTEGITVFLPPEQFYTWRNYRCAYEFYPSMDSTTSERQLFADNSDVDAHWLHTLSEGSANPASRYAVFSFLASFWRQDYEQAIASISQPTIIVVGDKATSISRTGQSETPEQLRFEYLKHLPQGQACQIPGRNVLPYESTAEFVAVVAEFVKQLQG